MAVEFASAQQVIDWLNRPENQFVSNLFIIRWDGHTPTIAKRKLVELNDPRHIGLAYAILGEHVRRKRKPDEQNVETTREQE